MPVCPAAAASVEADAAWGWDDNAREAMEKAEKRADRFLRLTTEATPDPFRWKRFSAGGRVRGLVEQYEQLSSESRYQGDGTLDLQQRLRQRVTAWGSGWVQGRTYPDSLRRSWVRGSISGGLRTPFRGGVFGLGFATRTIDYRRTRNVDRRSGAVTLEVRRPLRPSLEGSLLAEFETVHWDRPAIHSIAGETPEWSGHQRDRSRQFELGVRYLRGWLFEGRVGYESVRSNSFGYSIRRISGEVGITGWLPGSVLAQLRGRIESVEYRDAGLDRVFIVPYGEDLDAAQDNNTMSLRLRRGLIRQVAIEARASWFRNESLLVGYHYRKSLGVIGLVWTPVGASDF